MRHYLRLAIVSTLIWILCEVAVGLSVLFSGVRLWEYYKYPVLYGITSPVVWGLAFLLIPPLFLLCRSIENSFAANRWSRWAIRITCCCVSGSVLELIASNLFVRATGGPLYLYTFLPTFGGWGSLLSPIYYATVLIHFPVEHWLKERAQPLASRSRRREVIPRAMAS